MSTRYHLAVQICDKVLTCNSCTKCSGSLGSIIYECTQFPGHLCMDDLTTERCFVSQATWVVDILDLLSLIYLTCYPWVFVQPGAADVRSIAAGIKCLFCTIEICLWRHFPSTVEGNVREKNRALQITCQTEKLYECNKANGDTSTTLAYICKCLNYMSGK